MIKTNFYNTFAVFDFDGTLTKRDSLLPFLHHLVGNKAFYQGLLKMSPVLTGYALKLIVNSPAKEALISHFIQGKIYSEVKQTAYDFADKGIPKLLRLKAIQRLEWHQAQGHQTIVISASPEIYLLPWATRMGFDLTIATQLEVVGDKLNGRFRGKNCYGQEKVQRLKAMLGDLEQYCLYVYGDSEGDHPLLEHATYAYYRTFS